MKKKVYLFPNAEQEGKCCFLYKGYSGIYIPGDHCGEAVYKDKVCQKHFRYTRK